MSVNRNEDQPMSALEQARAYQASQEAEYISEIQRLAIFWDRLNNIHPIRVEANSGGTITTVDADGTRVERRAAVGRGVRITLGFKTEGGEAFDIAFQFHKGETKVELLNAADDSVRTIWKD
jgi:hypothetical protein